MENISNLATTGNFATETNGLNVEFDFTIDNRTKALKTINGGRVRENGMDIANFYMNDNAPKALAESINCNLPKGREVEIASVISNAITTFEGKIAFEL